MASSKTDSKQRSSLRIFLSVLLSFALLVFQVSFFQNSAWADEGTEIEPSDPSVPIAQDDPPAPVVPEASNCPSEPVDTRAIENGVIWPPWWPWDPDDPDEGGEFGPGRLDEATNTVSYDSASGFRLEGLTIDHNVVFTNCSNVVITGVTIVGNFDISGGSGITIQGLVVSGDLRVADPNTVSMSQAQAGSFLIYSPLGLDCFPGNISVNGWNYWIVVRLQDATSGNQYLGYIPSSTISNAHNTALAIIDTAQQKMLTWEGEGIVFDNALDYLQGVNTQGAIYDTSTIILLDPQNFVFDLSSITSPGITLEGRQSSSYPVGSEYVPIDPALNFQNKPSYPVSLSNFSFPLTETEFEQNYGSYLNVVEGPSGSGGIFKEDAPSPVPPAPVPSDGLPAAGLESLALAHDWPSIFVYLTQSIVTAQTAGALAIGDNATPLSIGNLECWTDEWMALGLLFTVVFSICVVNRQRRHCQNLDDLEHEAIYGEKGEWLDPDVLDIPGTIHNEA